MVNFDKLESEGGSVFPCWIGDYKHGGMTLSQWYAGQAMRALLSNNDIVTGLLRSMADGAEVSQLPTAAFRVADTMLAFEDVETADEKGEL